MAAAARVSVVRGWRRSRRGSRRRASWCRCRCGPARSVWDCLAWRISKKNRLDGYLQSIRIFADRDDAAGDDRLNIQGSGAGDQLVALGAGIQPDFADTFLRNLADHLLADVRRQVQRGHVDRPRHIEHGGVALQPFDFLLVGVDRNDGIPLLPERADRAVAELAAIARGADHGDDLGHPCCFTAETAKIAEKKIFFSASSACAAVLCSRQPAVAVCGACLATKASRRELPSFSSSIEVAYEIRIVPGASNASPGVTATFCSSSSASHQSSEVRRPSADSVSLMSTNR